MRHLIVFAFIIMFAACATAQSPAQQPLCSSGEYKQFDFWIGTWDVTDLNGKTAGRNVITSEEAGCLILETWTSVSGSTGQSYNFYDPGTKTWRQLWVSAGAVIDYSGGLTVTGSMRLEGEIKYHSGATAPFTGEWTLQEDGTVRQHFEQFDAESNSWKPWFTGIYTKVPPEP